MTNFYKTTLKGLGTTALIALMSNLFGAFNTQAQLVTIGSGTGFNQYYEYPAAYGNWYWGARQQFLYTAAELSAAGANAGNINSVAFNVINTNGAFSHNGYTIHLKNTSTTDLSALSWETGLTQVFGPINYTAVTGWNTHIATGFTWDGSSNILVEVCFNSNSYNANPSSQWTTGLSFAGSRYFYQDATGACTNPNVWGASTSRPNIRFDIAPSLPCSGAPAPGTTNASANPTCPGTPITLTVSGSASGSGLIYQWQADTGSGFSNIPGATNSSYTLTQTVATTYRRIIDCGGLSATSSNLLVNQSPSYNCGCASSALYPYDEEIFNVTVGALNNTSTCASTAPGPGSVNQLYSNYKTLPATIVYSSSATAYSIEIGTCGGNYPSGTAVFIDLNQDGDFTDAGEKVYGTTVTTTGPHTLLGTFTIPGTATNGVTAMRVINAEGYPGTSITPCLSYAYGETEDYLLNIQTPPPCSGLPAGGVVSGVAGACSGQNFTLTNSGYENNVTGLSYQWQVSTVGSGGPFNNIIGATNPASVTTSQSVSSWYRLTVTCANGGLTGNSTVHNVPMNTFISCYCPANSDWGAGGGWYGEVSNVTFNTINNASFSPSYPGPYWTQYPASGSTTTTVDQGVTYNLAVTHGFYSIAGAWFDWNQSGTFETTEYYPISTNSLGSSMTTSIPILIPATATGLTKFRIRTEYYTFYPFGSGSACAQLNYGETEDYTISVQSVPPCAGSPSGGTAAASPNTLVCGTTNINLTSSGATQSPGIIYQWESGPSSSGPWTAVSGGTNTSATVTQTASTWYHLVVTCTNSSLSATSSAVQVTSDAPSNCYCNSMMYTVGPVDGGGDYLNSIDLNGFSNVTGPNAPSPNFWIYTPSPVMTSLDKGSTYSATVSVGPVYGEYIKIWIDYNQDGVFDNSTGATSEVAGEVYTAPGTPQTMTFTIPATATLGNTRIRFRASYGVGIGVGHTPCSQYTYGETEDYVVTITQLPDCGALIGGTTASSEPSPCTGIPHTLSVTGGTTGVGGLVYQWQEANSCAGTWTDLPGGNVQNYNYTFGSASTVTFRRRTVCSFSNDTVYSTCLSETSTLCYCAPAYTSGTGTGYFINRVKMDAAGLDYTSGASGSAPYYEDLTGTVNCASLMKGAPFWINIYTGTNTGNHRLGLWIDYNGDGDFSDAGESMGSFTAQGGGTSHNILISVPNTPAVVPGTTRMRVRASANADFWTMDPCLSTNPYYQYGESEDYCVSIVPNACLTASDGGNITNVVPSQTVVGDLVTPVISGGVGTLTRWEFANEPTFTPVDGQYSSYTGALIANWNTPIIYFRAVYQNGGCPEALSNANFVKLDCAPAYTIGTGDGGTTTSGDFIDLVQISAIGLNNASDIVAVPGDSYADYTNNGPYSVSRQTPYSMTVSMNENWPEQVAVWIDQSGDGAFQNAEMVYKSTASAYEHTFSITIPCGSGYAGPAKMRVMAVYGTAIDSNACYNPAGSNGFNAYTYGEIEEYTLFINQGPSLTITPTNGVCVGPVTVPTASGGTGTYSWLPNDPLLIQSANTATPTINTQGGLVIFTVTGTLPNGCAATGMYAVANTPTGGTVSPASKVVCSGSSQIFTAIGIAGNIQWQTSTNGITWVNAGLPDAANTFTLAGITATTYVRALAQSVACYDIASTTAVVAVSATPVVTFTNVTQSTATVSWTVSSGALGAPSDYTVSWSGAAGSGSQIPGTNPFLITALSANGTLNVTVTKNAPACSGTSAATATTTTLCAKPTVSSVTAVVSPTGVKGLKVIWTAVAGATAYRVYYRPLVMNANWSSVDTAGGTTKTIMPLYAGVPYAVMVAANNCPGAGQLGQPSDVNYFTYTAPGLPACGPVPTITAVSNCPNQLTANLSGGTGTWRVTARRLSPSFSAGVSYTVSSPVVNLSITATPTGSVWEVFAQAVCGSSYSGLSNVEVVTVKAPCLAPQNVVVSHPDCDGFTVAWNPAVCGGLTLSNYQVYIKKSTAVNYVSYNGGSGDHKTFPYPALAPGTYTVFVRAITCNGSMSAASTVETGVVGGPGCKTGDEETTEATEAVVAASIYPNPTAGQFSVEVTATSKNEALRIEVADALGRVVYTDLSDTEAGLPSLRVLNLPESMSAGLYTVRIAAGQNTWTERLVLQRD